MAARGLAPVGPEFEHPFPFSANGSEIEGVNLLGMVVGTERPEDFLVITAHYDHLGIRDGEVFNGADDNASGTSALLALASHFASARPRHSVLFAALDAEEMGLRGSREFIADPPVPLGAILLNVNMDMVSRSQAGELYVAGTFHYPFLAPLVSRIQSEAKVTLLVGHDTPNLPSGDDWTFASDHGPFHQAGIPFVYFGVEDHPGYHAPTDDIGEITPEFFVEATQTVLAFVRLADEEGDAIWEVSGRPRP
jgi:Zn-dependent M28 family amino/carboxypeptidase